MKKFFSIFILGFFLTFLLCGVCYAEEESQSIILKIRIFNNGDPVEGAKITIPESEEEEGETDLNGTVKFTVHRTDNFAIGIRYNGIILNRPLKVDDESGNYYEIDLAREEESPNEPIEPVEETHLSAPFGDGDVPKGDIGAYIKNIYKFAVTAGTSLAVIMIMFAGYKYITSAGNPEGIAEAKDILFGSITGLVLILLTYVILGTIDPKLLEKPEQPTLSPLSTGTTGTTDNTSTTPPTTPAPPSTETAANEIEITFSVFDLSGLLAPLKDVNVEAKGMNSDEIIQGETDDQGRVNLKLKKGPKYEISFSKDGYDTQTLEYNYLVYDENHSIEIRLERE